MIRKSDRSVGSLPDGHSEAESESGVTVRLAARRPQGVPHRCGSRGKIAGPGPVSGGRRILYAGIRSARAKPYHGLDMIGVDAAPGPGPLRAGHEGRARAAGPHGSR